MPVPHARDRRDGAATPVSGTPAGGLERGPRGPTVLMARSRLCRLVWGLVTDLLRRRGTAESGLQRGRLRGPRHRGVRCDRAIGRLRLLWRARIRHGVRARLDGVVNGRARRRIPGTVGRWWGRWWLCR